MWSTKIAPFFMPAKAPSGPVVTCAQVVVVADAGEDEIGALGGLRAASAPTAPPILGQPSAPPWPRCGCRPSARGRRGSPDAPPSGNPITPRPIQAARMPWRCSNLAVVAGMARDGELAQMLLRKSALTQSRRRHGRDVSTTSKGARDCLPAMWCAPPSSTPRSCRR